MVAMAALERLQSMPEHERVELRSFVDSDLPLIADAATDALIPVITTVPSHALGEWSDQAGLDYLARQALRPEEGSGWSFAIVDRATNIAVGNLFINMSLRAVGCAAIGYWVGPSYRGQGFALHALEAVRDWGLAALNVDRLTLYIDPTNTPSMVTATRAGFEQEELLPSWEHVGDDLRDMTCWRWGSATAECAQLGLLEHRMWMYRDDPRWLDAHLHDEFLEFGQSGRPWNRQQIIDDPVSDIEVVLPLPDLTIGQIDQATWLVTYRSVQPHRQAHRASLWLRTDAGWRMRFHQGTSIPT